MLDQLPAQASGGLATGLPPVLPPLPEAALAALPSSLTGGHSTNYGGATFDPPGSGAALQKSGLLRNGLRPQDASSPDVAAAPAATSSGNLRHTSSGDTAASPSQGNSCDDADNTPMVIRLLVIRVLCGHKPYSNKICMCTRRQLRASQSVLDLPICCTLTHDTLVGFRAFVWFRQAHSHPQRHGSVKLLVARQAAATAREKNRAAQRRYRNRKKVASQTSFVWTPM